MLRLVLKLVVLIVVAAALSAGCSGQGAAGPPPVGQCVSPCEPAGSSAATASSAAASTGGTGLAATADSASATAAVSAEPTAGFARVTAAPNPNGCLPPGTSAAVLSLYNALSPQQQVGQLFMVGISSDDALVASLAALDAGDVGNVVLYGSGWSSAAVVQQSTQAISADLSSNDAGVAPFIGGNQEGGEPGEFQQFYGPGFDPIPSALQQGSLDAATLARDAALWGGQLLAAGVNLDLAPVLDVVPQATAQQNAPIGQYGREFGYDPETVANHGVAFIRGMHQAAVAVAIKHFPGLGRVQGNTDFTAEGIVDAALSGADDPFLTPFRAGIAVSADMVMISTAIYPQIDGAPAAFSPKIVTDLLRGQLGFGGVVISDDLGEAASVAEFSPADRALRFFAAGGDLLLTINQADVGPMTQAVLAQMQSDPAFACQIEGSVLRVLRLKGLYGLLPQTPSAPSATATAPPAQHTSDGRR